MKSWPRLGTSLRRPAIGTYTSAKCAQISPWVKPLADNEITRPSSPPDGRSTVAVAVGDVVLDDPHRGALRDGIQAAGTVAADALTFDVGQ
jgi:hypothetical protein